MDDDLQKLMSQEVSNIALNEDKFEKIIEYLCQCLANLKDNKRTARYKAADLWLMAGVMLRIADQNPNYKKRDLYDWKIYKMLCQKSPVHKLFWPLKMKFYAPPISIAASNIRHIYNKLKKSSGNMIPTPKPLQDVAEKICVNLQETMDKMFVARDPFPIATPDLRAFAKHITTLPYIDIMALLELDKMYAGFINSYMQTILFLHGGNSDCASIKRNEEPQIYSLVEGYFQYLPEIMARLCIQLLVLNSRNRFLNVVIPEEFDSAILNKLLDFLSNTNGNKPQNIKLKAISRIYKCLPEANQVLFCRLLKSRLKGTDGLSLYEDDILNAIYEHIYKPLHGHDYANNKRRIVEYDIIDLAFALKGAVSNVLDNNVSSRKITLSCFSTLPTEEQRKQHCRVLDISLLILSNYYGGWNIYWDRSPQEHLYITSQLNLKDFVELAMHLAEYIDATFKQYKKHKSLFDAPRFFGVYAGEAVAVTPPPVLFTRVQSTNSHLDAKSEQSKPPELRRVSSCPPSPTLEACKPIYT